VTHLGRSSPGPSPFKRSLLGRIVASFFALSAVIVLLITAVAYALIVGDARAAVVRQLDTLATAKTQAIRSWLTESRRRLEFAATMDNIAAPMESDKPEAATPDRASLRAALESVRSRWPELGELLFSSEQGGFVLASTTPALEGEYRVHDAWFVHGREGVYVQNVYPSPATLQPTLTISAPVLASSGKRLGVLAANLDLRVLDNIVRELSGPYPTAESYLVDRFSVFVSAERFGTDRFPRGAHSKGIDDAVAGTSGSGVYRSYRDEPVIGVYRWLPEHELAILVEAPTVDAFRGARREAVVIAGTGLAVVLLLAAGVWLLARRIASPILAIEEAARAVAAGDLTARAPVRTRDEIGALALSFNDMTAHLEGLYATLQRNEERFRNLIAASSDVSALVDGHGTFLFASSSVERLYGHSPAELLGTGALALVHPDDAERLRKAMRGLASSPSGESRSVEFRMRDREGRWHVIDMVARNLIGNPAVDGILCNARDITDRRHLEAELAQAQKMEAVGRLAGGIAHDFNNLLTAILGYAELVAEADQLPPEVAAQVAEISKAGHRAAGLTQQLLAYSRKQVLKPRLLDLNDLVSETKTLLARVIGEHIAIETFLEPGLPSVEADPGQLQRVIVNLAVNSRDAMPDGGTLTISTRSAEFDGIASAADESPATGPAILIEVADTGAGMDGTTVARLFEPFFTTKEVGKGTVLGLATVYGIVRQSGGRVTVQSTLGHGTTFRIFLPAVARGAPLGEPSGDGPGVATCREAVLIVEDEVAVRELMHEALARAGYRVVSTGNPTEAPALAEASRDLDLLVTDVVMPQMGGVQLGALLHERYPSLRILFVSGYTAEESAIRGGLRDELSFLGKPFTPAVLVRRVRDILDRPKD
jgi:two-component system, cell cycle sensor histidine kinase and response regulator CckA